MNYNDRWIFSMLIGTSTLFVLLVIAGPGDVWLDLLHMWILLVAVNHLRLAFSRNRMW